VEEMLLAMVKKTMDQHVLPNLAIFIVAMFVSFYLWMLCSSVDTFALVIKFLNGTSVPMHVIMGLSEMNEMTRQSMVA
jgi:nitrate/nitrite transporter NarK